jgi:hypothetical protein
MVMDEAVRRKDKALFDRAAALFQRHCEASDRVYGGETVTSGRKRLELQTFSTGGSDRFA